MTPEIWIMGIMGALVLASLIAGLAYASRGRGLESLNDKLMRYAIVTGKSAGIEINFNTRLGLWSGEFVVDGVSRYEAPYELTRQDARDKCIWWLEQELAHRENKRHV